MIIYDCYPALLRLRDEGSTLTQMCWMNPLESWDEENSVLKKQQYSALVEAHDRVKKNVQDSLWSRDMVRQQDFDVCLDEIKVQHPSLVFSSIQTNAESYDPTGAHPIGRGYPLIIQYIIEWILVSAIIWIIRGNSNIDISMIIL